MPYTIIISIYNEERLIPQLLSELKFYSKSNQILIIDDGSTDSSFDILSECEFITLKSLNKNHGKGYSIRLGIEIALYNKIIISDGDLELNTKELANLMILDKSKDSNFILGSRFNNIILSNSIWNFGNYFFSLIFNFLYKSNLNDVLCCAKSFYKSDLKQSDLKSKGFDIDIELISILIQKFKNVTVIPLSYKRRKYKEGKKINLRDSFKILYRLLICKKWY
ncbi:MAG: glycosyltransferase family 2 protein [Candidatus Neomarinimicrobiota bacterium]